MGQVLFRSARGSGVPAPVLQGYAQVRTETAMRVSTRYASALSALAASLLASAALTGAAQAVTLTTAAALERLPSLRATLRVLPAPPTEYTMAGSSIIDSVTRPAPIQVNMPPPRRGAARQQRSMALLLVLHRQRALLRRSNLT